ncbi:MAG: Na+/H+ antiporter NhaD/arsenite permease-like protein [Halieaceae bacterium]|jgi:Na+/H+ antiporter NhaD/arsenite permease-like protein
MVAGLSERAGYPLRFLAFLKIGLAVFLVTVVIANAHL